MFSPKSIITLALAANLVLGVPTWRRNDFPTLSEWKSKNLESYYKFKIRYRHVGCAEIEGSDFYNQCCVPLPKGQTLPEQCIPSSCSAHTPVPTPTETPAPAPSETYNGIDYSGNSGNDGNDGEDDNSASDEDTGHDNVDDSDLPYCDEVGEGYEPVTPQPQEPTTPAPPATYTPAPEETTTTEPEPTTPTEPEPTTTTEPEPTTTAPDHHNGDNNGGNNGGDNGDNNGGSGETITGGFATFYRQDGSLGACGGSNTDDEMIGAIDEARYGLDSVRSSECGRRVHITNTLNGKSVEITIVDDCPTCKNGNSIDLSPAAFEKIATQVEGEVPISWYYLPPV